MSRTYYVIELTARWLTVLVVGLALLLVLAFALGYGAAWSVLGSRAPAPATLLVAAPTPTVTAVYVAPTPPATVPPTAPPAAAATATPSPVPRRPTATPRPAATPTATATVVDAGLWVQVLASARPESVAEARSKLDRLGFPTDHQQVAEATVAGGNVLYKVRVGPFPDRESAERVVRRMQAEGFPDAWVVTP